MKEISVFVSVRVFVCVWEREELYIVLRTLVRGGHISILYNVIEYVHRDGGRKHKLNIFLSVKPRKEPNWTQNIPASIRFNPGVANPQAAGIVLHGAFSKCPSNLFRTFLYLYLMKNLLFEFRIQCGHQCG